MLQLRIIKIVQETYDTKSFYFESLNGSLIPYVAGQFLTFIFYHDSIEIRRSYSLGSSPDSDEHLFITVKRKQNGEISRILLDKYKIGDVLTALPPSGKFTIEQPYTKNYYFITAGSGVTPAFGLIKHLLKQSTTNVYLINQSRSEKDVIYKAALDNLSQKYKQFQWIQHFSNPHHHEQSIKRLNNTLLEAYLTAAAIDNSETHFYICGPLSFMRMAQFTLRLLGVQDDLIHKEQFVIERKTYVPLIADTSPKEVTIHYQQKAYRFSVAYPKSILDTALQEKIILPYSCRAGQCSTCMAKCIKGEVVMSTNEVLTEKDLAQGYVLTCVGFPKTDVELTFE